MVEELPRKIAGGVYVCDIWRLLPRLNAIKAKERKHPVKWLFFHHSGVAAKSDDRSHYEWLKAMAKYHVYSKGWKTIAYHWAIPFHPSKDGLIRVYMTNPPHIISNHTRSLLGRCNRLGEGVVLQGHHGKEPLSEHQIEALEAFIPWRCEQLGIYPQHSISWHSSPRFGVIPKLACPGKHAVRYLQDYINKS